MDSAQPGDQGGHGQWFGGGSAEAEYSLGRKSMSKIQSEGQRRGRKMTEDAQERRVNGQNV